MKSRKTQRRKTAETQSEELDFAPSRLDASASNRSGNALDSVANDSPSPARAEEGGGDLASLELPDDWHVFRLGDLFAIQ